LSDYRIESAITATAPSGPGPISADERDWRLLDLARRVKSVLGADAPDGLLARIAEKWRYGAGAVRRSTTPESIVKDFLRLWKKARPIGAEWAQVADLAARDDFSLALGHGTEVLDITARICRACSTVQRGCEFIMSWHHLGAVLGTSHKVAGRLLKILEDRHYLRCTFRSGPWLRERIFKLRLGDDQWDAWRALLFDLKQRGYPIAYADDFEFKNLCRRLKRQVPSSRWVWLGQ
jgi:hypothetical protein